MTIRRKLLMLLLAMALIPLILVSLFHQISIRLARQRLTGRIQSTLDSNAVRGLHEMLESYDDIFQREARLVEALIHRQAREVELRLSQQPQAHTPSEAIGSYGFDENLAELTDTGNELIGQEGAQADDRSQVGYHRQAYFVPEGVEAGTLAAGLERLRTMTAVYHEIHRNGPKGIL